MIIHPGFVGIDVSKHHLDVFHDGCAERFANTAESVAALVGRWHGQFVLFEATGCYDIQLRKALEKAGIAFARVNPARARDFARATGHLAKTDAIDARMLAAMAQSLSLARERESDPEREALARAHKRRDQLVHMRQQERTRLIECDDAVLRADLEQHLQWLDARIANGMQRSLACWRNRRPWRKAPAGCGRLSASDQSRPRHCLLWCRSSARFRLRR